MVERDMRVMCCEACDGTGHNWYWERAPDGCEYYWES